MVHGTQMSKQFLIFSKSKPPSKSIYKFGSCHKQDTPLPLHTVRLMILSENVSVYSDHQTPNKDISRNGPLSGDNLFLGVKEERNIKHIKVNPLRRNKTLLKKRQKGRGKEEEDVSSYWINLRNREHGGNGRRKN